MSYILNALKKAERDRQRENPVDIDDFASPNWNPYDTKPSTHRGQYMVLSVSILVILLAAMLGFYYLRPVQPTRTVNQSEPTAVSDLAKISEVGEVRHKGQDLSAAVKKAGIAKAQQLPIPALAISGHLFFALGSPSNRLFANGQSFKPGDQLDQHWRLEAIGLQGIKIRAGERSAFLPYP